MVWSGYHNALGLKKSSSPLLLGQETASVHDETSSSGNKEDEDDDDDDAEDKIDPQQYDPERLKAFNVSDDDSAPRRAAPRRPSTS